MHSADGTHTHEHAHDRDVSSANAANDLTSLTASATPENPTVHSRAASGVPGASDASLCVEAGSASTTTPTTFASAHARAEDAGTTESACKRCANPGNHKRLHTCNLKRAQPGFGSRERSSRKRMLSLLGPPEPRAESVPLATATSEAAISDVEMAHDGPERAGPETHASTTQVVVAQSALSNHPDTQYDGGRRYASHAAFKFEKLVARNRLAADDGGEHQYEYVLHGKDGHARGAPTQVK